MQIDETFQWRRENDSPTCARHNLRKEKLFTSEMCPYEYFLLHILTKLTTIPLFKINPQALQARCPQEAREENIQTNEKSNHHICTVTVHSMGL
jgi:hypothetical protein